MFGYHLQTTLQTPTIQTTTFLLEILTQVKRCPFYKSAPIQILKNLISLESTHHNYKSPPVATVVHYKILLTDIFNQIVTLIQDEEQNAEFKFTDLEAIFSSAENSMHIDNFLVNQETVNNSDNWDFITPIELIANLILKIAGLVPNVANFHLNLGLADQSSVSADSGDLFAWKLRQRCVWMLNNLNGKTGNYETLLYKTEDLENNSSSTNLNLAAQISNWTRPSSSGNDLLTFNEFLKFWSEMIGLIVNDWKVEYEKVNSRSAKNQILIDILTALLIIVGNRNL